MAISGREGERDQRERQRDGGALGDQVDDRHRVGVGPAEIEAEQPAGPMKVANQEALIEAHLDAQRLHRVLGGVDAEHQPRRIAGQDFQHREDDHRGHTSVSSPVARRLRSRRWVRRGPSLPLETRVPRAESGGAAFRRALARPSRQDAPMANVHPPRKGEGVAAQSTHFTLVRSFAWIGEFSHRPSTLASQMPILGSSNRKPTTASSARIFCACP